ncbi:hypothetical protein QL285_062541 [Trifolium repens]|nr:hypothetical protein QL285_062541 [Trifolium repens]
MTQICLLWPECFPFVQFKTIIWPIPSWVILIGFNIHILFNLVHHLITIPNFRYSFILHHFNPLTNLWVVVVVVTTTRSFDLIFLVNNPLVEGQFSIWVASDVTENTRLSSDS